MITISSGEGLGDTEVVLKAIEAEEDNAYKPAYLTSGMQVKIDAERGAWFKIGVSMQNETGTNITVYVEVLRTSISNQISAKIFFNAAIAGL